MVTVPPNGLRMTFPSCVLTFGGTISGLTAVTPTTPPALFSVNSLPVANAGLSLLSLAVTSATAGCATLFNVLTSNRATLTAVFAFSQPLTGTLV